MSLRILQRALQARDAGRGSTASTGNTARFGRRTGLERFQMGAVVFLLGGQARRSIPSWSTLAEVS
jgi:hypothetical protein